MIDQWRSQLKENSGNLTTNAPMPAHLVDTLLEEDASLAERISFTDTSFPKLAGALGEVDGLNIIAGLQNQTRRDYLTVFRAVRFPTYKRLYSLLTDGFTISNYEQERILELYRDKSYLEHRAENQSDERFWVQPQERVVRGVPVFALVNDALQIHRAFRGEQDEVALAVIHIPREHLESGTVKLITNAAIDLDYENSDRDISIRDFREKDGVFEIDYAAMRARGVDVHEMYSQDLPLTKQEAGALDIQQEFYLVDIYSVNDFTTLSKIEADTQLLKKNRRFLHGLFGDQNIFGRRRTKYLPYRCQKLELVS